MLTDQELIRQVRRRLEDELAEICPADAALRIAQRSTRQLDGGARRRRRLPERASRFSSVVGVALAIAVVAAVVVIAVAVGGRSQSAPEPATFPSSAGHGGSEEPLLRILGILRRPQTRADLPPALMRALHHSRPSVFTGTPDLAGVRLATVTPTGEQVFLVPYRPPTPAAISAYVSGLAHGPEARFRFKIGASLRAQAARGDRLEIRFLAAGVSAGETKLMTPQMIERQGAGTWTAGYTGDATQLVLVVPDGVAKVAVIIPQHVRSGIPAMVNDEVHNNVLAVLVRGASAFPAQNMIWYGPTGNVVKVIGNVKPAPVPDASSVRTHITVHVFKARHYCYKRLAVGSFVIPCDSGLPFGYKPAPWASRSLALADISFIARLPATNKHSVYEFSYGRASGPANCTLNTGGTSGTTMVPVRAGQRVTIQDDQEVCPGTYEGVISYQPNGGPGSDTLNWGRPIRDGSVLVGRFRYVMRR